MNSIKRMIVAGAVVVGAQGMSAPTTVAPGSKPAVSTLRCPAGARAMTDGQGLFCSKSGVPGSERLNGPYIGLHKNGAKEAEGTYVNGERVGHWQFFDEAGAKVKEIDFKSDHYEGRFVEYYPSGQVKLEASYVRGKRSGAQRQFSAAGQLLAETHFENDRLIK